MPVDSTKKADNTKLFTGTTQPPLPPAGISNDQARDRAKVSVDVHIRSN